MIYKTIVQRFNSFVHKISHIKKEWYAYDGVYTYTPQLSLLLCASCSWPSFMFTRYLRIVENYTLSIFMLSGSTRFYSQIQFNIRHAFILNHTFYFIHDQCKTILMLIHFHILSIYGSLIIYKYVISYATNHSTIQFMRFKHTLLKMCLVYKSHFCFTYQNLLYHFDYTIYIHEGFSLVKPVFFVVR